MSMADKIDMLDGFSYSTMSRAQLRVSFEESSPDQLTRTFAAFHRTLDLRVSELVDEDPGQLIIFSDSAFAAFRYPNTAAYFAQDLCET
jgi:hypothetical protein